MLFAAGAYPTAVLLIAYEYAAGYKAARAFTGFVARTLTAVSPARGKAVKINVCFYKYISQLVEVAYGVILPIVGMIPVGIPVNQHAFAAEAL